MIGSPNKTTAKNVFYVKALTKDANKKEIKPTFNFQRKIDGEYKDVETNTSFSGILSRVDCKSHDWQSPQGVQTITSVGVTVTDGEDQYVLDLGYNILGRSVFNSLLGLELGDPIQFSIYLSKPTEKNKNKSYPQIAVRTNDQLAKWVYGKGELPEIVKVKLKGKDVSDTTDIDKFFESALTKKFKNSGRSSAKATVKVESQSQEGEDVPF